MSSNPRKDVMSRNAFQSFGKAASDPDLSKECLYRQVLILNGTGRSKEALEILTKIDKPLNYNLLSLQEHLYIKTKQTKELPQLYSMLKKEMQLVIDHLNLHDDRREHWIKEMKVLDNKIKSLKN